VRFVGVMFRNVKLGCLMTRFDITPLSLYQVFCRSRLGDRLLLLRFFYSAWRRERHSGNASCEPKQRYATSTTPMQSGCLPPSGLSDSHPSNELQIELLIPDVIHGIFH